MAFVAGWRQGHLKYHDLCRFWLTVLRMIERKCPMLEKPTSPYNYYHPEGLRQLLEQRGMGIVYGFSSYLAKVRHGRAHVCVIGRCGMVWS
jgi:hypothetical protein